MGSNKNYYYKITNGVDELTFTSKLKIAAYLQCWVGRVEKLSKGVIDNINGYKIEKVVKTKKHNKQVGKFNIIDGDQPFYVMESGYDILYK